MPGRPDGVSEIPWFKVDDNLAFHHKTVAAGNAAMGLWVRAGSWAAQQLTDGFVPDHMIATLGTKAQAQRLVSVGLWAKVERGYEFHEWNERQPLKESVEAERAAARERMARRRSKPQVSGPRSVDVRANNEGTSGDVRQPRPDPTRPEGSKEPSVGATGKPAKRATQLPSDWQPNDRHREMAVQDGLDLNREAQQFKDHALANGKTYKDWDAAFRTWLTNSAKWGNRGSVRPPQPPRVLRHAQEIEQPPDGLTPAEYAAWERETRERRRA